MCLDANYWISRSPCCPDTPVLVRTCLRQFCSVNNKSLYLAGPEEGGRSQGSRAWGTERILERRGKMGYVERDPRGPREGLQMEGSPAGMVKANGMWRHERAEGEHLSSARCYKAIIGSKECLCPTDYDSRLNDTTIIMAGLIINIFSLTPFVFSNSPLSHFFIPQVTGNFYVTFR